MTSGTRLSWTAVIVVLFALLFAGPAEVRAQQTGQITGEVVSASNRAPLAGAQILVAGTGIGGITNSTGRYFLTNVPAGEVTVRVQMIGYGTEESTATVPAGQSVALNFELSERALELDAVVVTGTPGARQLRSLGNVVGRVAAADLQRIAPQPNLESMLSGNVPGLNIAAGSGTIGAAGNIRIRGVSSLTLSSRPLLYIDGVRVNNVAPGFGVTTGTGNRNGASRLNDISPEMIESIEVIKGPAAATLYGTEASNGVINIITKTGVAGEPVFNLTAKLGQNWYPDPKKHWQKSYFTCTGTGTHDCEPGEVVGVNVFMEDYINYGMDHFRVGAPWGLTGSVSGGAQELRYYFGLGWDRDEGPVPINNMNSLNARANLDWLPREDLDIGFRLGVVRSHLRSPTASQPARTVGFYWSCPGAGCERGTGLPNALDGPFRGYIAYLPDLYDSHINGGQDVNRYTSSLTASHRPFEWLTHRLTVGLDHSDVKGFRTVKHLQGGVGLGTRRGARDVEYRTTEFFNLDYSGTVTFEPVAGLSLNTSSGIQFLDKTSESLQGEGDDFAVPTLETITAGENQDVSDDFLQNKTIGVYVQEQVSWQNRLFLTGAVRGDDNSAFGQNYDFVVYPKLSASWVASEESFVQGVGWLNSLRFRGAWGQAGQQPDMFAGVRLYRPVPAFQGEGGLVPQTIGNPDVEPEVGEEFELGFDAGVWDDRLGIQFTYYNQKRKNALIAVPVKPSTGFPGTQFRNIGEILNTGIELGLQWDAYRGQDVNLHVGASIATNSNKITDMGGLGPQPLIGDNSSTGFAGQRFIEGFPLGAIFLPRVVSADIVGEGLDAHAVNVMCESGPVVWPGTRLTRGGGPPVPCTADDAPEVYMGQTIPTRQVSLNATLTLFQDVQLFAHLDYMGGHTMIDGHTAAAHMFFRNTKAIEERTDPILLGYDALGSIGSNQPGLFDASFARLRRVSLSYTFPGSWAANIGASRATLTLSGQNLWMPWRAQKYGFGRELSDPELRTTGGRSEDESTDPGGLAAYTQDAFPLFKRFLATLRVTF